MEQYLNFELVNVHFSVKDGKEHRRFDVNRGFHACGVADFQRNEFEQKFYNTNSLDRKENMICFNQSKRTDVFFKGNRDYEVQGKNTSYLRIRVSPCHDSRLTEEQRSRNVKCKSPDEIEKWRQYKMIMPFTIESRPNFGDTKNNDDLVQTEKWWPAITLKKGFYTDHGYRMRYHEYIRNDKDYFSPWVKHRKSEFYDMTLYNADTIPYDEDSSKLHYFA